VDCSCWFVNGRGEPEQRRCSSGERQDQECRGFPDCGFVEGNVSHRDALAALQREREQGVERAAREEGMVSHIEGTSADDAKFLNEVNHGVKKT